MKQNSQKAVCWPGVISDRMTVAKEYADLAAPSQFNALAMPAGIIHRGASRKIDWLAFPEYRPKGLAASIGLARFHEPSPTEILLQSLHYACLVIEKHLDRGSIYLVGADLEISEIDKLLPYWGKIHGIENKPRFGGYEEAEGSIDALIALYERSPRAAAEITKRFAMNIAEGNLLSKRAAEFVGEILGGWRKPPKSHGKPQLTHRDTLLVLIAIELQERAGYDLAANVTQFQPGQYPKPCGATIAAAALGAFGFPIQARTALNIINNRGKCPFEAARRRAITSIYDPPHSAFGLRRDAIFSDKIIEAMRYFSTPI